MHHNQTLPGSPGYTFIDHGGGSHLPMLLSCVAATEGSVLEIGVGHGSTPCLHALCCCPPPGKLTRRLVSLEDDPHWLDVFSDWRDHNLSHELYPDTDAMIDSCVETGHCVRWGVVFIDDSPGGAPRAAHLERFLPVADYVVMHDAEATGNNYGPAMEVVNRLKVPHMSLYTRFFPHTLALSLTRPIPQVP